MDTNASNTPSAPSAPDTSNAPSTAGTPTVPGLPAAPSSPHTPTLPSMPAQPGPSGMSTPPSTGNALRDKRILVVEDNVDNYTLIVRLLTELGIEHCEWLSSGWKVAQAAEQYNQPDLILLDINLPYEDGFAVYRKLREHPRLNDTKIVAVTANANQEYMQRTISAGFDGFIGKPLDPDRFPEQVRRLLKGEPVWEFK